MRTERVTRAGAATDDDGIAGDISRRRVLEDTRPRVSDVRF